MSELTAPRDTVQYSTSAVPSKYVFPVGANTQLIPGGLAMLSGGFVSEVTTGADTDGVIVGVVTNPDHIDQLNNLTGSPFNSGAAGAFNVEVTQGAWDLQSGTGVDAITAANVGEFCYASDDQTVNLTPGNGTRPRAGRIIGIDPVSGQVKVLVGFINDPDEGGTVTMVATAALSQGQIVALDTSTAGNVVAATAGQLPIGVVQNSPGIGGAAKVRTSGFGMVKMAAATTVGEIIASNGSGLGKVAVTGNVSTTNVQGSNIVGQALTSTGGAGLVQAWISLSGVIPTTAQ